MSHRLGYVMANACIDESNIDHGAGQSVLLLPFDPDASADHLKHELERLSGVELGVIINDSFGRL